MQTGLDGARSLYKADRRKNRRCFLLSALLLLILFCVFLCFRSTEIAFLSPAQTVMNLYTAAKLEAAKLLKLPLYSQRLELIQAHTGYLETLTRLQGGILAIVLGAVLSVAGAVFQCVFRNPIAMPTMLGVSSGISIGNFILVLQYSSAAVMMTTLRFVYGYAFSLALLFVILLMGYLTGERGRLSTADILLAGSAMSRVLSKLVMSLQYSYLEESDYLLLQEMSLYGTGIGNTRGAVFLFAALILGLVPVVLMRNSLNVVTFPDEEARCMGLRPGRMRVLSLVCGTILIIAAQIHCGEVGMLALLVPHICRYIFGSNTRELIIGSMLYGAIMMLVCRMIISLFAFNQYLSVISVGMLISFVSMPLMMFILIRHRRGWN